MWNQSKSKFGNKKVTFGNETFDSKGEWQRWLFLQDCARNGQIKDLKRQVKFTLVPTQYKSVEVKLKTKTKIERRVVTKAVTYTADFVYSLNENIIIERYGNEIKRLIDEWDIGSPTDDELLEIAKYGIDGLYSFAANQEGKKAKRLKVPIRITEQWKRTAIQEVKDIPNIERISQYLTVVEDFKGMPNDRWPIKKALMLSVYGIEVREVKKPTEPV